MNVANFGVHWAPGGIPFLLQSGSAQNLISPDLGSPFVVQVRPKFLKSPHAIDLATHVPLPDWVQDPLAQAFLPVPVGAGNKVKLVLDPDRKLEQLVMQLSRLCSPVEPIVRPLWWRQPNQMTSSYSLTNISPMIFIGGESNRWLDAQRHLELAQTHHRQGIILTRERLAIFDAEWVTTELTDVGNEPLEAIGAGALRRHMLEGNGER